MLHLIALVAALTVRQNQRAQLTARDVRTTCPIMRRRVCRREEVIARRREEIDRLAFFAEPCLVLRTPRNDHDVAQAADPLFAAEAELPLSIDTICSFA